MNLKIAETKDSDITTDTPLMNQVLNSYFDHTRYLKSAIIETSGDPSGRGKISARCKFEIPASCYIKDTGHFNSVEFNLCYNQMMYYVIAKSVKHQLMDAFKYWKLQDYFKKQLPDILIVNFKSTFKYPLQAANFWGEIDFVRIKVKKIRKSIIYLKTLCRFYDGNSGYCEGEVDLAIIN